MSKIKFYDDLNFFEKLLIRLHLKKVIKTFSEDQFREYVENTLMLEKLERDDENYNRILRGYLGGI